MERHTANGDRGFTLIELLVVMAIIATLMTLVTPQYFRQHTKAQETVLRHNLSSIRQALDQYREDNGANPESLQALVDRGDLRKIPMDPLATFGRTRPGRRTQRCHRDPGQPQGAGTQPRISPGEHRRQDPGGDHHHRQPDHHLVGVLPGRGAADHGQAEHQPER